MMTGYMLHDSGSKFWLGYENGQFNDPTNNVRARQKLLYARFSLFAFSSVWAMK